MTLQLQYIGAAIAIGMAGFGAAFALGMIGKSRLEALGRNPDGAKNYFVPAILALALTEAVAIYGFVIAFSMLNQ